MREHAEVYVNLIIMSFSRRCDDMFCDSFTKHSCAQAKRLEACLYRVQRTKSRRAKDLVSLQPTKPFHGGLFTNSNSNNHTYGNTSSLSHYACMHGNMNTLIHTKHPHFENIRNIPFYQFFFFPTIQINGVKIHSF